MIMEFYRPTVAIINLDHITHNVDIFRKRIEKQIELMAVVKADAYGHGLIPVVKHLRKIGIKYFAVATLDEALEFRKAGIDDNILVLGYTPIEGFKLAIEQDITLTVFTREMIVSINDLGEKLKKKAKIHIKIDTGMGRIGIFPKDAYSFFSETVSKPWIEIEGIYTHFATADEKDKAFTLEQYETFLKELEKIKTLRDIPLIHLSNSAALADLPNLEQNIARLGIALYGLLPSNEVSLSYKDLKPVMSLKTKIIYLKMIEAGMSVSYGATFRASKQTLVATLPIGYADGFPRRLSNKGVVLVNGKRAPIIGRICMDQMMIDVTNVENVQVGDEVTLFGYQGEELLSLDEHAEIVDTINYELITLIGKRVPRVYYHKGEIVEVLNYSLL